MSAMANFFEFQCRSHLQMSLCNKIFPCWLATDISRKTHELKSPVGRIIPPTDEFVPIGRLSATITDRAGSLYCICFGASCFGYGSTFKELVSFFKSEDR